MSFKPPFAEDMTLKEAQDTLRPLLDEGHKCPVCTQFAKTYRRKIHSAMARDLIAMASAGRWDDREWVKVVDVAGPNAPDLVKCRYWGLLEQRDGDREDGSSRNGWWRMTEEGLKFVRRALTVPKYARLYDGRFLSFEGGRVTIEDALGKKFRYDELMAGV